MRGGGSIQVARILGIRVGVTPSWLIILFLFIIGLSGYFKDVLGGSSTQAYVVAVAATVLFYVSILLHELGHALVSRRRGLEVERIDLWFFGGLTYQKGEVQTPGTEFAIAVAGPLVTLGLTVAAGVAALLIDSSNALWHVVTFQFAATDSPAYALLAFLFAMNAFLFAFNLLPGFPLDGGRIALAVAWRLTGDRNRGSRFAGQAGLVVAYALGGLGLYLMVRGDFGDGIWLLVLAWLLAPAARAAVVGGTTRERLHAVTVADVMDPRPVTLDAETTLLEARERVFEPNGWPFVPVVDHDGRFLGVLERDHVEHEIASGRPALRARDAVEGGPGAWGVGTEQPLEALLSADAMGRIGAVFAVDAHGVLRGVVTLDQLRRALAPAPGRS